MKSSGIVRKVDDLGRIVIPKETRKILSVKEGDSLEIFRSDNEIVLKKYAPGCTFCESMDEISSFKGVLLCRQCKNELISLKR